MPPAFASCSTPNGQKLGTDAATSEVLSPTTLSSIVSVPSLTIPPPSLWCPFGALTATRLSLTTLRLSVSVAPGWLLLPPPWGMVAAEPSAGVEPATLSVTRVLVSVRFPLLSIPPPQATAHGAGPQNLPAGKRPEGVTLFPVTKLSEIVTVARGSPGPGNGIDTPPPAATPCSSTSPPVIVMRLIETVGWGPMNAPIVMSGPPPWMVVAPAALPTRSMLFRIVIPPANVPGPTAIVSPSWAALTAAWIVAKQPGLFASTQRIASAAADPV